MTFFPVGVNRSDQQGAIQPIPLGKVKQTR